MSAPRIVCLIATWRGEGLLAEAVASALPHVDRVIVLDGAYSAVVPEPTHWTDVLSTPEEVEPVIAAGAVAIAPCAPWRGEIEKRNVLLELGRAFVPGERDRWALVLDEDEVLVRGELLRGYIETEHREADALGLVRIEPSGVGWAAPSRLFRLTDTVRYAGRSYWLFDGGRQRSLEHFQVPALPPGAPYVEHRWDRRSEWRREVQRRYGRHLAELDHG